MKRKTGLHWIQLEFHIVSQRDYYRGCGIAATMKGRPQHGRFGRLQRGAPQAGTVSCRSDGPGYEGTTLRRNN